MFRSNSIYSTSKIALLLFIIWAITFIYFMIVLFDSDDESTRKLKFYARFVKSVTENQLELITKKYHSKVDHRGQMTANFSKANCGYMTMRFKGKTGNQMFQYASFYGLAKGNNKIGFVNSDFPLFDTFKLTVSKLNKSALNESNFSEVPYYGSFGFKKSGLFNLSCEKDYLMRGLRSSWRNFDEFSSEIKKEFQFVDAVNDGCNKILNEISLQNNISRSDCIFIGAHMRRGNFVLEQKQDFGHVPATKEYLNKSIDFFENRFNNYSCKLFIVLGNDYEWNLENSPKRKNVIVLKPRTPDLDLCVLSRCNHTIISSGSFSWWAGYLSGGDATYMANQCRPNSTLCSKFNISNYINPDWNWFPIDDS